MLNEDQHQKKIALIDKIYENTDNRTIAERNLQKISHAAIDGKLTLQDEISLLSTMLRHEIITNAVYIINGYNNILRSISNSDNVEFIKTKSMELLEHLKTLKSCMLFSKCLDAECYTSNNEFIESERSGLNQSNDNLLKFITQEQKKLNNLVSSITQPLWTKVHRLECD